MDQSLFKDLTTSRGIKYHYFYSPPTDVAKPVLLLIHGFPSTSYDWHRVTPFFLKGGFGVLVPDLLGYGLTDKPKDTAEYVASKVCKDLIDILDFEKVEKVVAVGHDWGSKVVSRLANFYPERFLAFAFFAASYIAPATVYDYQKHIEMSRSTVGHDQFGYWEFFAEEGSDKVIEQHWDSFHSIIFPHDPLLWRSNVAPLGALRVWVQADRKGSLPHYLTEEDKAQQSKNFLRDGIRGGLNWYKLMIDKPSLGAEDDKAIPISRYDISHPTFFGAALQDQICVASLGRAAMGKHCTNATIREFDADHWVILSHGEEVADALTQWVLEEVLKE
ncbi:hypothetical protein SERLA73DRAFT_188704 [Serpula lacrymans var. lacrymans S7.3]|uniref:AB hydrolase-1 domain-containing protein n=2 Tax=Serpula lacrymans var. lacrymans TaxID=341189 RepID=F8QC00_SERL3|nr:uncharacterized protein SERLADRAFT_479064 [Serpula lacrymans var. lacrymans S7.9]EGN94119.1 hypothetical protein SERLA73DRAFT_188704 [Serpula lacrymans var. lacrymans S7.3]EGO19530.1 hypothetical protein SERLADRAFT_479064 [Serpula lacrymans var. lacrymans S7.9]